MIKRRKPMPQGTPLKRTEFKRKAVPFKSGGTIVSPVKPRKRASQSPKERAARELLKKRSGGRCEIQASEYCTGVGEVWSHRKRRSQSSRAEKWAITNGLHGCWFCELYLTDHGNDARVRSRGWTVHPSLEPAAVPVWRCGQYVWLLPDGSIVALDLQEIAEWVAA